VANGPNIFQMLLVFVIILTKNVHNLTTKNLLMFKYIIRKPSLFLLRIIDSDSADHCARLQIIFTYLLTYSRSHRQRRPLSHDRAAKIDEKNRDLREREAISRQ